jgi:glycosyltransferase involved in cell wall biosynthesis/SAM-dependent methyltransferase
MELTREPGLAREYDQYHRYATAALLLRTLPHEPGRTVRVLEVGSNAENLLPQFLGPLPVAVTRADLEGSGGAGPDFVPLREGEPLPFADNAFDFVVALEVLEHIPAEDRTFAVGEWARVARRAVVFTAPDGSPEVREAEAVARRAYEHRHGRPHRWLAEHEACGLPTAAEVAAVLDKLDLRGITFAARPLAEWLPLLLLTEELAAEGEPELPAAFGELLASQPVPAFTNAPAYRRVVAAFKSADEADRAAAAWRAVGVGPRPGPSNRLEADPVVALAGRLREVFRRALADRASAARQLADARAELDRVRRALDESRPDRDQLERRLWHTRLALEAVGRPFWHRLWGGVARRLARRAGEFDPASAAVRELLPPRAVGGLWESLGDDPQLHFDTALRPGWALVRLAGQFPAGVCPKLYADCGQGFDENTTVVLGPWPVGPVVLTRHVHFPGPVRALRFDPLESPGLFRLEALTVRPCSRLRVVLGLLAREAWTCRRPRTLAAKLAGAVRLLLRGHPAARAALLATAAPPVARYGDWVRRQVWTDAEREGLERALTARGRRPSFAVVVEDAGGDPAALRRTLASLTRAAYGDWELWLPARAAPALGEFPALAGRARAVPAGLDGSAFLNHALAATGAEYLVPVAAGDQLADGTLLILAERIAAGPEGDVYYSDEDHWSAERGRHEPHFKPDWSPDLFLAYPYLGRLTAYGVAAGRRAGGFRPDADGAQEMDLVLRLADAGAHIVHIPRVLCHRALTPGLPPLDPRAAGRVVGQRLRQGVGGVRGDVAEAGWPLRPSFALPAGACVSIIIPTAGRPGRIRGRASVYVLECLKSIRDRTTWPRREVIVVEDGRLPGEVARECERLGARRVVVPGPFNFAASLNAGAAAAAGEYLLFLNDDTEVIAPDWIERMLEYAAQPGVGAVGAKLFFPDGRLQHAGVLLLDGGPTHPFYGFPGDHPGHHRSLLTPRTLLAVTGACLLTPRAAFAAVGGFDTAFPLNYNDVDYCLRLRDRGLRTVFTPHARLYHHETMGRDGAVTVRPWEQDLFRRRWGGRYPCDPFYNPNLAGDAIDYRLRM